MMKLMYVIDMHCNIFPIENGACKIECSFTKATQNNSDILAYKQ